MYFFYLCHTHTPPSPPEYSIGILLDLVVAVLLKSLYLTAQTRFLQYVCHFFSPEMEYSQQNKIMWHLWFRLEPGPMTFHPNVLLSKPPKQLLWMSQNNIYLKFFGRRISAWVSAQSDICDEQYQIKPDIGPKRA